MTSLPWQTDENVKLGSLQKFLGMVSLFCLFNLPVNILNQQECVPVGYVPPTLPPKRVSMTDPPPPDRDRSGQRPRPSTEIPLERDPPWTDKRFCKHYLPATSFAGGKNSKLLKYLFHLPILNVINDIARSRTSVVPVVLFVLLMTSDSNIINSYVMFYFSTGRGLFEV